MSCRNRATRGSSEAFSCRAGFFRLGQVRAMGPRGATRARARWRRAARAAGPRTGGAVFRERFRREDIDPRVLRSLRVPHTSDSFAHALPAVQSVRAREPRCPIRSRMRVTPSNPFACASHSVQFVRARKPRRPNRSRPVTCPIPRTLRTRGRQSANALVAPGALRVRFVRAREPRCPNRSRPHCSVSKPFAPAPLGVRFVRALKPRRPIRSRLPPARAPHARRLPPARAPHACRTRGPPARAPAGS